MVDSGYVVDFTELSIGDVAVVGGKNASLGEMSRALAGEGIPVPPGFAVTADAYRRFLSANSLENLIAARLSALEHNETTLSEAGRAIRSKMLQGEIPAEIKSAITSAYRDLSRVSGAEDLDVAVRSSATAEDLPDASFAGQQETFLNVSGEQELLEAYKRCLASLFNDRAIAYRQERGFAGKEIALSVGIQRMVRSDLAGAGVMFTIDTETGFPDVVAIDAVWGLGETLVQGSVTPDSYAVFKKLLDRPHAVPIIDKTLGDKHQKLVYAERGTRLVPTSQKERVGFVLDDSQVIRLARWAVRIEQHYGRPMDIEWALDGKTKELFIVQARPETVQSRTEAAMLKSYRVLERGPELAKGIAIGDAAAAGPAVVLTDLSEAGRFRDGGVLVTTMTDPDWVPVMRRAVAIVTDHGGRTSHAAIVSRELGVPAVVGTKSATSSIKDGQEVTVSCAEGETGVVYDGRLKIEVSEVDYSPAGKTRTKIMVNLGDPHAAMRWWRLPCDGVGLARMEFIIENQIKIHPMALVRPEAVQSEAAAEIRRLTAGWEDPAEFFVDTLAHGIAKIAASQWPGPVIVRTSDFKTNEYRELIGGASFEPQEENPMLGFRGASRYYSDRYRDGFALECRALKKVREEIGLDNVVVMIPFCRTIEEADRVLEVMAAGGLARGEAGLKVYVMAEIPSNIILAEQFAERFDGFSVGSNDLTQLVLGIDRDSESLAHLFDERNPAVVAMIGWLIEAAKKANRTVGICGQAPSDHPGFAEMLVKAGIDSISLNPDSVMEVRRLVAECEAKLDS